MANVEDIGIRRQALDVSRSFLVQAPAGSGKTELLTQRFLALLARVEQPEAVLAITFTRKAAGEMRDRVLRSLQDAEAQAPFDTTKEHEVTTRGLANDALARDRQLGWKLLHAPARLRIQTIDSLCTSIAYAMPAAAGFGGAPKVTESPDELYAAAAHAAILLLADTSHHDIHSAVAGLLAHLDNDAHALETLLVRMLQKRDQWLRLVGTGADQRKVRCTLDATLAEITARCLRHLREAVPRWCARELVELTAFAADQAANAMNAIGECAGLDDLPGCAAADRPLWQGIAHLLLTQKNEWRSARGINASMGFAPRTDECRNMKDLVERLASEGAFLSALQELRTLPPVAYDDGQWEIAQHLFRLLPRAVAELKRIFAGRNQVDFAELAQAALQALGPADAPSELAFALGYRIEHLLVDEYQDTSVTQQRLLERLTGTWEPGDGRTVFLVGDPMQSIYRFRQAEVGLFLDAAANGALGQVALAPLELTVNFRSQRRLVDWINETFPGIFPPANDVARSAVRYSPAVAFQSPAAVTAVTIHPFIGELDDALRDEEAEHVLQLIAEARERDPRGSIAVLVRAREHLATLVPRLRERGVHFRAVEIQALAERQIILDLVSLTRALLHLADRVAWLSVLRAPWCGLDLQDLYALCARDEYSCIWDLLQERRAHLSADGRARLERFCAVLASALEQRGCRPVAQWIRGVWLALGGPACVTSTDLEDASTFFDLLDEIEDGGGLDDDAFAARIGKLFAHPDVEADGSLQVMSIHRAKGLEFDTVIVPALGRIPRRQDSELLLWMERVTPEGDPELLVAPISRKGSDTDPLYKFIRDTENARAVEEDKRLLYVAVTRAKTQLHLLGHACVKDGELKEPTKRSFLSYLWPTVEDDFRRASREQRGTQDLELAAAEESRPVAETGLKALPPNWTPPACPAALPCEVIAEVDGERQSITFDWVSDSLRHVGTVTHALLHRIARDGVDEWDAARLAQYRGATRAALVNCGVISEELDAAARRVESAIQDAISSARGRWVLGDHNESAGEYPLSGVVNGKLRHFKLDRTFVADGVRWIVDYKTSHHEGAGLEAFLDNEVRRYREQLESYARLLAALDPRPIRLGLYFPLLGEWREWKYIG